MFYLFQRGIESRIVNLQSDTVAELGMQLNMGSVYCRPSKEYNEAERQMLEVVSLAQKYNKQFFLPAAYDNPWSGLLRNGKSR